MEKLQDLEIMEPVLTFEPFEEEKAEVSVVEEKRMNISLKGKN